MSSPRSDPRYELFAWDYEIINPLDPDEVTWYADWAQRSGGALLGLACGTGRLVCRLAEQGSEVVGMDLSASMLDIARTHVAVLEPESRARVQLVRGDMSRFDLGRKFGMVFIADNSFRELKTNDQRMACLECIRSHLEPAGRLLVAERRFYPAEWEDRKRVVDWTEPIRNPETGDWVSRRIEMVLSEELDWLDCTMTYKTPRSDGTESFTECCSGAAIIRPEEFRALFDNAGFEVRVFDGYGGEVGDRYKSRWVNFVCTSHA